MTPPDAAEIAAWIRSFCAPAPGHPDGRWSDCTDCGEPFWRWRDDQRRYCPSCGVTRQRTNWAQKREEGRRRWLDRLCRELDALESQQGRRRA